MTGVQTCALPICFPVTIGYDYDEEDDYNEEDNYDDEDEETGAAILLKEYVNKGLIVAEEIIVNLLISKERKSIDCL